MECAVVLIKLVIANCFILLLSLVSLANASDASPTNKFLGSPLLMLTALIVVDAIAFAYHRLRK